MYVSTHRNRTDIKHETETCTVRDISKEISCLIMLIKMYLDSLSETFNLLSMDQLNLCDKIVLPCTSTKMYFNPQISIVRVGQGSNIRNNTSKSHAHGFDRLSKDN